MKKLKRPKVIREVLEARLLKNERRIQRIAEESYALRQSIAQLDSIPARKPLTKEDMALLDKKIDAVIDAEDAAKPAVEENNAVS